MIFLRDRGRQGRLRRRQPLPSPAPPLILWLASLTPRGEIPLPLTYGCDVFPSQGTVCTYRCVRLLLRSYSNRDNG